MEELVWQNLQEGFKTLLGYIEWVYMVVFILVTWLFNSYTFSKSKAGHLNVLQRIPPHVWAVIIGMLLAIFWVWGFDCNSKDCIVGLFFTLIFAMVIYKFGIGKLLEYAAKKRLKT